MISLVYKICCTHIHIHADKSYDPAYLLSLITNIDINLTCQLFYLSIRGKHLYFFIKYRTHSIFASSYLLYNLLLYTL